MAQFTVRYSTPDDFTRNGRMIGHKSSKNSCSQGQYYMLDEKGFDTFFTEASEKELKPSQLIPLHAVLVSTSGDSTYFLLSLSDKNTKNLIHHFTEPRASHSDSAPEKMRVAVESLVAMTKFQHIFKADAIVTISEFTNPSADNSTFDVVTDKLPKGFTVTETESASAEQGAPSRERTPSGSVQEEPVDAAAPRAETPAATTHGGIKANIIQLEQLPICESILKLNDTFKRVAETTYPTYKSNVDTGARYALAIAMADTIIKTGDQQNQTPLLSGILQQITTNQLAPNCPDGTVAFSTETYCVTLSTIDANGQRQSTVVTPVSRNEVAQAEADTQRKANTVSSGHGRTQHLNDEQKSLQALINFYHSNDMTVDANQRTLTDQLTAFNNKFSADHDGITDQIVADLARFNSQFIIAIAQKTGIPVDIQQLCREHEAKYGETLEAADLQQLADDIAATPVKIKQSQQKHDWQAIKQMITGLEQLESDAAFDQQLNQAIDSLAKYNKCYGLNISFDIALDLAHREQFEKEQSFNSILQAFDNSSDWKANGDFLIGLINTHNHNYNDTLDPEVIQAFVTEKRTNAATGKAAQETALAAIRTKIKAKLQDTKSASHTAIATNLKTYNEDFRQEESYSAVLQQAKAELKAELEEEWKQLAQSGNAKATKKFLRRAKKLGLYPADPSDPDRGFTTYQERYTEVVDALDANTDTEDKAEALEDAGLSCEDDGSPSTKVPFSDAYATHKLAALNAQAKPAEPQTGFDATEHASVEITGGSLRDDAPLDLDDSMFPDMHDLDQPGGARSFFSSFRDRIDANKRALNITLPTPVDVLNTSRIDDTFNIQHAHAASIAEAETNTDSTDAQTASSSRSSRTGSDATEGTTTTSTTSDESGYGQTLDLSTAALNTRPDRHRTLMETMFADPDNKTLGQLFPDVKNDFGGEQNTTWGTIVNRGETTRILQKVAAYAEKNTQGGLPPFHAAILLENHALSLASRIALQTDDETLTAEQKDDLEADLNDKVLEFEKLFQIKLDEGDLSAKLHGLRKLTKLIGSLKSHTSQNIASQTARRFSSTRRKDTLTYRVFSNLIALRLQKAHALQTTIEGNVELSRKQEQYALETQLLDQLHILKEQHETLNEKSLQQQKQQKYFNQIEDQYAEMHTADDDSTTENDAETADAAVEGGDDAAPKNNTEAVEGGDDVAHEGEAAVEDARDEDAPEDGVEIGAPADGEGDADDQAIDSTLTLNTRLHHIALENQDLEAELTALLAVREKFAEELRLATGNQYYQKADTQKFEDDIHESLAAIVGYAERNHRHLNAPQKNQLELLKQLQTNHKAAALADKLLDATEDATLDDEGKAAETPADAAVPEEQQPLTPEALRDLIQNFATGTKLAKTLNRQKKRIFRALEDIEDAREDAKEAANPVEEFTEKVALTQALINDCQQQQQNLKDKARALATAWHTALKNQATDLTNAFAEGIERRFDADIATKQQRVLDNQALSTTFRNFLAAIQKFDRRSMAHTKALHEQSRSATPSEAALINAHKRDAHTIKKYARTILRNAAEYVAQWNNKNKPGRAAGKKLITITNTLRKLGISGGHINGLPAGIADLVTNLDIIMKSGPGTTSYDATTFQAAIMFIASHGPRRPESEYTQRCSADLEEYMAARRHKVATVAFLKAQAQQASATNAAQLVEDQLSLFGLQKTPATATPSQSSAAAATNQLSGPEATSIRAIANNAAKLDQLAAIDQEIERGLLTFTLPALPAASTRRRANSPDEAAATANNGGPRSPMLRRMQGTRHANTGNDSIRGIELDIMSRDNDHDSTEDATNPSTPSR